MVVLGDGHVVQSRVVSVPTRRVVNAVRIRKLQLLSGISIIGLWPDALSPSALLFLYFDADHLFFLKMTETHIYHGVIHILYCDPVPDPSPRDSH